MAERIQLGEVVADVTYKAIKNIHLSVYPPNGAVRISAPVRMSLDSIRVFALSKLVWIREQQRKMREQQRETPREYLNRESHYFRGQRYLLRIIQRDATPKVEISGSELILQVRPGADAAKREAVLDDWYRGQIKQTIAPLRESWQPLLGVQAARVMVQRMKTRWGSCNPDTRIIRINLELIKKPPECLEYILVHELTHLIEPTHNRRFVALMDLHMPKWRFHRDELNRLPVRHESWRY